MADADRASNRDIKDQSEGAGWAQTTVISRFLAKPFELNRTQLAVGFLLAHPLRGINSKSAMIIVRWFDRRDRWQVFSTLSQQLPLPAYGFLQEVSDWLTSFASMWMNGRDERGS